MSLIIFVPFQIIDPDQRVPSRQGGQDVQILRLEPESLDQQGYYYAGSSPGRHRGAAESYR